MVEKVNGGDNLTDSENTNLVKRAIHIMEEWKTTQSGMPNTTIVEAQKSQEVMNLQEKLITVKKIFLNIGKQTLETSYTLSLGQLFKIALMLKRSLAEVKTKEKLECK